MLELFPAGFEELETRRRLELAAYTNAAGEERIWQAFGGAAATEVETGWEERWRQFHRPVRVGPLWIGPPWEEPDADAIAVVIDPGRAFGTGGHPTTQLCLQLLLGEEPGSLLDVGCGSGVLAIAAAKLGFDPVLAIDFDPQAIEATRAQRRRERASSSTSGSPTSATTRCRRRTLALANIAAEAVARARRQVARAARDHLRLPRLRRARTWPGYRRVERRRRRRLGGRSARPRLSSILGRDGAVLRRLPRLQGLAHRRAGDSRAAARRRPRRGAGERRRRRRQHVLRHERGAREVAAGGGAGGAHARARLRDGLRGQALRGRLRGPARERHRRPRPDRGGGRADRRRRRRDRLRPGRRAARPDPRLREDPGRLLVLVPLLRHPARARRDAQPARRRRARRDPQARRAGPPRDRAHRRQPRLLPRPRGRLHARAADPRGRRSRRCRAAAPLLDRDQPRERRARRRAARDADGRPAPARPAPVRRRRRPARDGAPLLASTTYLRKLEPLAGLQPHRRRDRRLPRRGRRRLRAHGRDRPRAPA